MNTLFITGAGTHIPYGFPSGQKLITDIIYGVRNKIYAKKRLGLEKKLEEVLTQDLRITQKGLLNRFINQLSESGQSSIDKFLSLEAVSEDVGKVLLMTILSIYECQINPHGINLPPDKFEKLRRESIYNVIVNTLDIVNEGRINKSIKYITFNYDRCLEYFLYTTFLNSYGIEFQQSHKYIDNQIIHVHGSIGDFCPPRFGSASERLVYGSDRVLDHSDPYLQGLVGYIDNFQTAFNSNHSQKKEKISNFIREADEIVFLGFAFADENMKALSLYGEHYYEGKDIYCCTYGLTNRKIDQLKRNLDEIFNNSNLVIEESGKKDGASFLRDHWVM